MNAGVVCYQCGASVDTTALFCPQCGVDVSGEHPVVPNRSEPTLIQANLRQALRDETLGEYEILTELGRGGMATVFLAHEIALDRKVAIKVMSPHLLEGEGMVERFKLEARTAAQLSHPHIVPIYAVRETENTIFFVMKFIEGRGLNAIIKKLGPLPIPMVKDILTKVGGALGYAHRHHVVHRDVKPSNIMIDDEGTPIVTDFGIAKVAAADELTVTGTTIGTPSYMSPEQCDGSPVTGACDQYSLGVVAFEMLTGRPPFVGDSPVSTMYKHCHMDPPPLEDHRPDCPPEVVETVMRMLAKNPRDRWPSLEAAVQKLVAPAYVSERRKVGAPRPAPRRPTWWRAAAVLVLVLGAAGILAVQRPWAQGVAVPTAADPRDAVPADQTDPVATEPPGAALDEVPDQTPTPVEATEAEGDAEPDAEPPPVQTQPPADEPPAPARVASLRLGPAPDALVAGESAALSATPVDAGGAALTGRPRPQWTSSNPSVARVGPDGRVVAVAPGSAVITASVDGVSVRHALTVTAISVASVTVTPDALSLDQGQSATVTAEPLATDGSVLAGRPVRWTTSDEGVVQVSESGQVTAVGAGEATITATVESEAATVRVTVAPDTRTVLDGLIAAYAAALESGDIDRIRAAYPGLTTEQEGNLRTALSGMQDLQAGLSISELTVEGARATAQVGGTYRFINTSNGRAEVVPIAFTAVFERAGSAWTLVGTR